MEAHLVHYNAKYKNINEAITKSDGLAVVAFFICASGQRDCVFFRKITDRLRNIKEPNMKCTLDSGCIMKSHKCAVHSKEKTN